MIGIASCIKMKKHMLKYLLKCHLRFLFVQYLFKDQWDHEVIFHWHYEINHDYFQNVSHCFGSVFNVEIWDEIPLILVPSYSTHHYHLIVTFHYWYPKLHCLDCLRSMINLQVLPMMECYPSFDFQSQIDALLIEQVLHHHVCAWCAPSNWITYGHKIQC